MNVLEALHDLTHEPTPTERLVFTAQSRIVDTFESIYEAANDLIRDVVRPALERGRDRVH